MDDREYHLRWLMVGAIRVGVAIDIEVAEVGRGDTPLMEPRKAVDWRKYFARMARRDARRLTELEERLDRVRAGRPHIVQWTEARPPRRAVEVSVNGEVLDRAAVGHPGSLTVDVVALQRGPRRKFSLNIHGGECLGKRVWRWYEWPWNGRALKVGDRIRIEAITSKGMQPGKVREVSVAEPLTEQDIVTAIENLRKQAPPWWHENEAAMMIEAEKKRRPPRRYAGGKLVR